MADKSVTRQPNQRGEDVARAWAEWHIGDASFASEILWAYLNPDEAEATLEEDKNS